MAGPTAMATTKMGNATFGILSIIGIIIEGIFIYLNGVYGYVGIILPYAIIVVILFGVGFFGFTRKPDNTIFRGLVTFFAPAIFSILGVIMVYLVLKGRNALG